MRHIFIISHTVAHTQWSDFQHLRLLIKVQLKCMAENGSQLSFFKWWSTFLKQNSIGGQPLHQKMALVANFQAH